MLQSIRVKKILNYLRKTYPKAIIWKLPEQNSIGIPDIFFAYEGLAMCFEVKRPRGTLTPSKFKTIKKLNQNYIPTFVVDSVDNVKKYIKYYTS
jgi:hypothetical protein